MRKFSPVRSPLQGGTTREFPHVAGVAYILTMDGGKTLVKAYSGKRNRPDFFYSFASMDRAESHLASWVRGLELSAKARADRAADRKAFAHTLQVGDVLVSSWGYDQTNVDFYQVVAVVGKSVDIRPIGQQYQETGFMSGDCVPAVGEFTGDVQRRLVQQGNSVKVSECSRARPADFTMVGGMKIFRAYYSSHYA